MLVPFDPSFVTFVHKFSIFDMVTQKILALYGITDMVAQCCWPCKNIIPLQILNLPFSSLLSPSPPQLQLSLNSPLTIFENQSSFMALSITCLLLIQQYYAQQFLMLCPVLSMSCSIIVNSVRGLQICPHHSYELHRYFGQLTFFNCVTLKKQKNYSRMNLLPFTYGKLYSKYAFLHILYFDILL